MPGGRTKCKQDVRARGAGRGVDQRHPRRVVRHTGPGNQQQRPVPEVVVEQRTQPQIYVRRDRHETMRARIGGRASHRQAARAHARHVGDDPSRDPFAAMREDFDERGEGRLAQWRLVRQRVDRNTLARRQVPRLVGRIFVEAIAQQSGHAAGHATLRASGILSRMRDAPRKPGSFSTPNRGRILRIWKRPSVLLTVVLVALIGATPATLGLKAQGSSSPTFEGATIKPWTGLRPPRGASSPDRFVSLDQTLRGLVEYAYELTPQQVVGV